MHLSIHELCNMMQCHLNVCDVLMQKYIALFLFLHSVFRSFRLSFFKSVPRLIPFEHSSLFLSLKTSTCFWIQNFPFWVFLFPIMVFFWAPMTSIDSFSLFQEFFQFLDIIWVHNVSFSPNFWSLFFFWKFPTENKNILFLSTCFYHAN